MRRAVRVGLVVLGAATAVYGVASLTGGWLGTPPWWEMRGTLTFDTILHDGGAATPPDPPIAPEEISLPNPDRERDSALLVAGGLALVVLGAWPRQRRRTDVASVD